MTFPYFISATCRTYFFSPFSSFNNEKLRCKYYNKQIATRDNGNVESHDQEESKLNSTNNVNSGPHALTHDKLIKNPLSRNNLATIKSKQIFNKDLIAWDCQIDKMVPM